MDKCIGCNFYDRQLSKQTDSRGVQWGQCRRGAPMLHPINQKSYMIEGVWPHVRDDDWCGEWKVAPRRADARPTEVPSLGPLLPIAGTSQFAARSASVTSLQSVGSSYANGVPPGAAALSGRGDD